MGLILFTEIVLVFTEIVEDLLKTNLIGLTRRFGVLGLVEGVLLG